MLQPQLSGNRVVKRFYQPANTLKHTTWYARDAQACPERRRRGNILSIYERATPTSEVKQTEVHIYGSSRIGIEQRNITYSTSPFAWLESEQHRHAGTKRYELADHLGNVRVTISNLLVPRPASSFGYATQDAEVIDRRDYYPFGMEMPGRRWRATGEDAARFGFNGKENDNEVKGEGNQQDYGFRIYDPRVARFLSVDPLAGEYVSYSPYSFALNDPTRFVDLLGLGAADRIKKASSYIGTKYSQKKSLNQGSELRTGESSAALEYLDCSELVCRVMAADEITDRVLAKATGDLVKLFTTDKRFVSVSSEEIKPGDIFIWRDKKTVNGKTEVTGHTGIVESVDDKGNVTTIEAQGARFGTRRVARKLSSFLNHNEFAGFFRPLVESPDGKIKDGTEGGDDDGQPRSGNKDDSNQAMPDSTGGAAPAGSSNEDGTNATTGGD